MAAVTIKELFEAGVHFGHRTQRWNPKMRPYIFEARNGIYLIDLEHTFNQLREASAFLRERGRRNEKVLFIGCKKPAQESVREAAERAECPYVCDRWLGGTLTNLQTIRRSVQKLEQLEDLDRRGQLDKYSKKEASQQRREMNKLRHNLSGIRKMDRIPSAVVIVDITREQNALAEAKRLGIPVVAIVDTNADPTSVDYPVVGNDDAIRSIKILAGALASAYSDGRSEAVPTNQGNQEPASEPEPVVESSLDAVSA